MNSRLTFLECVAICLLLCSVNIVISDENIESQLHTRLDEVDERQAQLFHIAEIERQDVVQNIFTIASVLIGVPISTLVQVVSVIGFVIFLPSNIFGILALGLLNLLGASFSLGGFASQIIARSIGYGSPTSPFLLLAYSGFAARILGLMCLGDPSASNSIWKEGLCTRGMEWFSEEINGVIEDQESQTFSPSMLQDNGQSNDDECFNSLVFMVEESMNVKLLKNSDLVKFKKSKLFAKLKKIIELVIKAKCKKAGSKALIEEKYYETIKKKFQNVLNRNKENGV